MIPARRAAAIGAACSVGAEPRVPPAGRRAPSPARDASEAKGATSFTGDETRASRARLEAPVEGGSLQDVTLQLRAALHQHFERRLPVENLENLAHSS